MPTNGMLQHSVMNQSELDGSNDSKLQAPESRADLPIKWRGPLRILVLDDQLRYGWKQWLNEVLPEIISVDDAAPQIRDEDWMDSSVDPMAFIDRLESALRTIPNPRTEHADLRFRLSLGEGAICGLESTPEILLLDLRLFADVKPGEEDAEGVFLRRICDLCYAFSVEHDDEEAERLEANRRGCFSKRELDEIRLDLGNVVGELGRSTYEKALTLLPRLIGAVDFSYPIIIFSSAGNPATRQLLEGHPGIITAFRKPAYFYSIDPENIRNTAMISLHDVFQMAMECLNARLRCQTIICAGEKYVKYLNSPVPSLARHIELFLDETGFDNRSTHFSVGGYFAVWDANTPDGARQRASKFNDILAKSGLRYYNSLGTGPAVPTILSKAEDCNAALEAAKATSPETYPSTLGVLRVRIAKDSIPAVQYVTEELEHPLFGDNRFRIPLGVLIELFFSESMPILLENSTYTSLSVFAGTRAHKCDTPLQARQLSRRFGYPLALGKQGIRSFSPQELFPIVEAAARYHKRTLHSLDNAIAFRACYDLDEKGRSTVPNVFVCAEQHCSWRTEKSDDRIHELFAHDFHGIARVMSVVPQYGSIFLQQTGITGQLVTVPEDFPNDRRAALLACDPGTLLLCKFRNVGNSSNTASSNEDDAGELVLDDFKLLCSNTGAPGPLRIKCGRCNSWNVRPECKDLWYLSDEILRNFPPKYNTYPVFARLKHGEFDTIWNSQILELVHRISRNDTPGSVAMFPLQQIERWARATRYLRKPPAEVLAAVRLSSALAQIQANEFTAIARAVSLQVRIRH